MSYKVLYRKYRPNNFKNIIGQNNIVSILKNSIINNNFSHAYIFTGPRGTGKTSTAKVLAKTVNCENPVDGEACGKCHNCINFNTSPDIIEIDAASNNGVDEIRELRNNISLAPSESKYKIYIIDEVHMLTSSAFNALLKTLEEPPPHAIFILATTEIYKVPITILSRCQRFDFKKINKIDMVNYLKKICEEEKISYDEDALDEIYVLSEGCLRDSLSILDQSSKFSEKITYEDLIREYNIVSINSIENLINECFNSNYEAVVSLIQDFENAGTNIQRLIKRIIEYLENYLLNKLNTKYDKDEFINIKKLILDLDNCYTTARVNENVYNILKIIFLDFTLNYKHQSTTIVNSQKSISQNPNTSKKTEDKIAISEEKKEFIKPNNVRVNNALAEATKSELNKILLFWKNNNFSSFTSLDLNSFIPVVSSKKYTVFSSTDKSLVDLFNLEKDKIEKELQKSDINNKVVALFIEDWNHIRDEYIKNIKNGFKYEFIEEKEENINLDEVNDIFENQKIEII